MPNEEAIEPARPLASMIGNYNPQFVNHFKRAGVRKNRMGVLPHITP